MRKIKTTTCKGDLYFHSGFKAIVYPYWELKLVGILTNPNGDEWDIVIYCKGTGASFMSQLYNWVFKSGRNPFKKGATVEKTVTGDFIDPKKVFFLHNIIL